MNAHNTARARFEIRSRRGEEAESVEYSRESACQRTEPLTLNPSPHRMGRGKVDESSLAPCCSTLEFGFSSRRRHSNMILETAFSLFLVVLFASAPCFGSEISSKKDKESVKHQRGWIGGEYKLARRHWSWSSTTEAVIAFPDSLTNGKKAGILITGVSTNTPAYLAGLREADLILEMDGQKMTSLSVLRRKIDQTKPGASLVVRAYRNGELQDYSVTVGRETFIENGAFGFGLPLGLPDLSLKFNPSFSLIALGLAWESDQRTELGSGEQIFRRENVKEHHPTDVYWRAWAGPFFLLRTRQIYSQEMSSP
jgi:hypothetical protein